MHLREAPPGYLARNRLKGPLFRVVLDHLEEFAMSLRFPQAHQPQPHPGIVDRFRKYIECGLFRFGVVRFRCPDCGQDLFVPFSCKIRGLCPSCDAKRATVTMANAVDRLLPEVAYRQWVLVIPKRLRFLTNLYPELIGEVASILARAVELRLKRKLGEGAAAHVAFVQRFGGELNLHPHIHSVVSDGVFFKEAGLLGKVLGFKPARPPTAEEIAVMTESIRRKVLRRFKRLGYLSSVDVESMLSWQHSGFSLHAEVCVPRGDRKGLQRVLYYCGRPALSMQRVTYYAERDLVVYRTEPRGGESWSLTLQPLEFLRRWALLAPPPRKNLVRYYGALGPNSPLRELVVEAASKGTARARLRKKLDGAMGAVSESLRSWAACLNRVFEIDPLVCPRCAVTMVPVAVIMKDSELARLLTHLGLETAFPQTKPAKTQPLDLQGCGPPDEDGCQIDPKVDLYEAVDPPGLDEAA